MTGRILLSLHIAVIDCVKLTLATFSLLSKSARRDPALSTHPYAVPPLTASSCPCVTPSLVLTQLSVRTVLKTYVNLV